MSSYVDEFIGTILEQSNSNEWETAKYEWLIDDYDIDTNCSSECICGHQGIKFLYKIRNEDNGNAICPIGSSCIKKFEREEFNENLSVNESYLKILEAVEDNQFLELKGGLFSRKLINYFYDQGIFEANQYNGFNPSKDRDFLIKMFNSRKPMTRGQQAKARGLIGFTIVPYIKDEIEGRII